jgi:hypothetical protein
MRAAMRAGKATPSCQYEFSSAMYAQELVTNATSIMGNSLIEYLQAQGRKAFVEPALVLQQASVLATQTGAASVLLGALDPLRGILRVAKLGDVGFAVLRPPPEGSALDLACDLEVWFCRWSSCVLDI